MIGQENLNLFQVQKWSFAEGNAPGAELDLVYHNSPPGDSSSVTEPELCPQIGL